MKTYHVEILKMRTFTQTLDPNKLSSILNEHAQTGWKFARSMNVKKRVWLFFSRPVYYLIFEKD